MKTHILIYLILFLSISYNSEAQSTIKWSKTRKLTWSDFKAKPNDDISAGALTASKIEIQPTKVLVDENGNIKNYKSLTAVALFFPKLSWVRKKKKHLLLHEQLHFDIVELFTRKLNIKFSELKTKRIAKFDSYMNAYKELWAECRQMQKKYDKETDHGQLIEENIIWKERIMREIEKQGNNYKE